MAFVRAFVFGGLRRVLAVLVPVLLLAGGSAAGHAPGGGWFCADGALCAPAGALACCCGCPEGAPPAAHRCGPESGARRIAPRETCGCTYRTAASLLLPARFESGGALDHGPPAPAPGTPALRAPEPAPSGPPPLARGRTPVPISASRAPRAPPA